MPRQIFRQESLEKLNSPDELDRLFTLIPFRAWVPLAGLGAVLVAALVWAVLGRIPDTVEGAGVMVNPGRVRSLQVSYTGQVVELKVRPGQTVKEDEVLAVMNQPELRQSLTQAQTRLTELKATDKTHAKLEADRMESEKKVRDAQELVLKESIDEIDKFGNTLAVEYEKSAVLQKKQLVKAQEEARALNTALAAQFQQLTDLGKKKLVTDDTIVAARAQLTDSNLRLAEIDLKAAEITAREIELKQSQAQLKTKLAELRSQLRQLEVRDIQLKLESAQSSAVRASTIAEQSDRVALLEQQLKDQGAIRSAYSGRVLEVATTAGQMLPAGSRLGAIEVDDPGAPSLRNLAYFPLAAGKRLQEGMTVRVTPTTVQRERFGSIVGKVVRVSPFPITGEAAAAVVGNTEVLSAIAQPGGMIEVEIELEADPSSPSGFKWTSAGPPFKFSAGTTTGSRVTVEQRAPISYLIPILAGL